MSSNTKFGFPIATLVHYGESICDAGEAHVEINPRLPANFIGDTRILLNAVNTGTAGQKSQSANIGTLTEEQDNARLVLEDWVAKARASAKRAFTNKVKLHEEFQVGAAKPQTLAALLERARIILASCQEPANAAALQTKGWLPADTTALSDAITALDNVDDTQETAKGSRKQATASRNAQADALYENLLTIQNAANLQWPATNGDNIAIRSEFQLETFPKDARTTPVTPPATTHMAAGFGDARANGVVTGIGTLNGKPLYQIAGGTYLFNDAVTWRIQVDDPRVSQVDSLYSRPDVSEWGEDVPYTGTPPGGTITAS